MARIEKLRKRLPDEVTLLRDEPTGAREYRVPKSCIDIKIPPRLSEAESKRRSLQAVAAQQAAKEKRLADTPEIREKSAGCKVPK